MKKRNGFLEGGRRKLEKNRKIILIKKNIFKKYNFYKK